MRGERKNIVLKKKRELGPYHERRFGYYSERGDFVKRSENWSNEIGTNERLILGSVILLLVLFGVSPAFGQTIIARPK
jgi:hypothetical protein